MDIKADSLYQQMQAMSEQVKGLDQQAAPRLEINTSGKDFADMLNQAVDTVNAMQGESREAQKRFEMGDPSLSLADVMVAKEKSGIAFEATLQVRNKVLEAYKTIMNMQV